MENIIGVCFWSVYKHLTNMRMGHNMNSSAFAPLHIERDEVGRFQILDKQTGKRVQKLTQKWEN